MLQELVKKYLEKYPAERAGLNIFLNQLEAGEDLQSRKNFAGHVVGTAVILSPDKKQALLIYHPTFKEWQQPGGHWDEGEDGPWQTAEREAVEETSVSIGKRLSYDRPQDPWLIETHVVPENKAKQEPTHYHHAFWYAFQAASKELDLKDDVIKDAKWVDLDQVVKPQVLIVLDRLNNLANS